MPDADESTPGGSSGAAEHGTGGLPTTRRTFVGLVAALSAGSVGTGTAASSPDEPVGYGEGGFGEGPYGGVVSTAPRVDDYADDDGVVHTGGLREAIDDWRAGRVETGVLRDVIDAWRTGGA